MRPSTSAGRPRRGVTGSAALTAASLLASMGLGALLAVLVLHLFGKGVETDAFFAAYGVFALFTALAQSLRVTLVPRLAEGGWAALDRFFAALVVVAVAAALPMLLFGGPLAGLLVSSLGPMAEDTARSALALLWLAGALQLVAGTLAAAHGARQRFGPPAVAYIMGSMTALATLLALAGALGIRAASTGLVLGGVAGVAVMLASITREGYRPSTRSISRGGESAAALGPIVAGSLPYVVVQITYVISLAYAARIAEGAVTLYTYAFFASVLIMAATGGPASIVLAGPLSLGWDRRPRSLLPHLAVVTRAGLLLAAPALAAAAFVGDEAVDVLLGATVDATDGDSVVASLLALSGVIAAWIAGSVPLVAAFIASRYAAVGAIALITVLVHVALTALALSLGGLIAIALAASASTTVFLVLLLMLVWGRRAAEPARLLIRETAGIAAVALGGFGPAWLAAGAMGGGAWQVVALPAGLALMLALVRLLLPDAWATVRQLAAALVRRPSSVATS